MASNAIPLTHPPIRIAVFDSPCHPKRADGASAGSWAQPVTATSEWDFECSTSLLATGVLLILRRRAARVGVNDGA
ncbi:hypothetical protein GCM10009619_39210 [Williamsia maris]